VSPSSTVICTTSQLTASPLSAEEVENASRVIPKAVIGTACIFFAVGYSIMILSYFCFPAEAVLTSAYAFPVIDMFLSITQSKSGTATLVALIITMLIFGSIGILAAGSRMLWAFARESGVPGSRFIAAIHPSTHLPLYSILVTALISILLGLIGLGSSAALNALTGLAVAGFYTAFIIAASMMLWRRLTMPAAKMPWGPFRLHAFGVPITILSLTYSVIGVVFSFWPPVKEVDKSSFNWSVVVFVGVIMLACGWWGVKARKTYTGPKVEISSQQWMDLFKEPEGGAAEHKSHEA
jgi:choline transport protein